MNDVSLSQMILPFANSDALAADVEGLYRDLDQTIASHKPTCWNHGNCCRFAEFGHRLYVTTVELAYFTRGLSPEWKPPIGQSVCPYQIEGKCTARAHRPVGCRIFFCDPDAQHWQNAEYEARLAGLKRIGEVHGVPYRYQEWLSALAELDLPRKVAAGGVGSPAGDAGTGPIVDPAPPAVVELPQVRSTDSHR